MRQLPVGIQLYTVQAEVNADPRKAIESVAKIGYTGIEGGGDTFGIPPQEYKRLLSDLGLTSTTLFVCVDELEGDFQSKIDLALEVGIKRIGIPAVDGHRRADKAGWLNVAAVANRAAAICQQHGLEFIYHNHSFEFATFDGQYGLDIFYENTDSALVKAELDTYWLQHGKVVPAEYIKKLANRLSIVHVKDMLDDADRSFAEVGEGILDWQAILNAASASTAEWLIVEQDVCNRPCLESAKLSFDNLTRMLADD